MFSMAVNTLRPKKNASPQSKAPGFGPPRVLNAVLWVANSASAFSMLKFTGTADDMLVPWLLAVRLSGEVVGQYQCVWSAHVGGTPAVLLLRKKIPLDPLSMKLCG